MLINIVKSMTPPRIKIELGSLYRCDSMKKIGLYGFQEQQECPKEHIDPLTFKPSIFQFKPTEKIINVYLCRWYAVNLSCEEHFFGDSIRQTWVDELVTIPQACKEAVKTKRSPHGHKILKLSENHYKVEDKKVYPCHWLQTNDQRNFGYEIRVFQAFIRSEQDIIHQSATKSRCSLEQGYCYPIEDHKQVLVYQENIPTLPSAYKYIGDYKVTQIESLITIPAIGSGGSIAWESDNSIMLDTGYLLRKNKTSNLTDVRMLSGYDLAIKVCEQETTSPAVERLAGMTARALAMIETRIKNLEHLACKNVEERSKIKQFLLKSFPSEGNSLLSDGKGQFLHQLITFLHNRCLFLYLGISVH